MAGEQFTRREVERAYRKFKDLCNDLFDAKFQTWPDNLTHLLTHCEQNPVMRAVTDPLRENKNVDAAKWYRDALASVTGMVGSGQYQLPVNDDDRTALLYQFLVLLDRNEANLVKFCQAVYGSQGYQNMVTDFNRELVLKFAREVEYRLDESTQDIGDAEVVSRETIQGVFHYHDNRMNINGGIHGSNVAIGGSTVSDSTATYTTGADLAAALKALKPIIQEVSEGQRAVAEAALQRVVEAAEGKDTPEPDLVESVKALANSSVKFVTRLKDIVAKIGPALAGSALFHALKAGADGGAVAA